MPETAVATTEYRALVKGWKGDRSRTFVSVQYHATESGVASERARIGEKGLPAWQPHITEVVVEKRTVTPWEETDDLG
jgi:hypothetical protein